MSHNLPSYLELSGRSRAPSRALESHLMVATMVALLLSLGTLASAAGPPKAPRETVHKVAAKRHPASSDKNMSASDTKLRRASQKAFLANNYARALALGLRYLKTHPHDQGILGIVGMAACKLHHRATIARIWPRAKQGWRALLRQVCLKSGITLRRGKVLMPRRPRRRTRRRRPKIPGSDQGIRSSNQARQVLQAAATPLVLTPRMTRELRSCFPPPLMASAHRYSGVWVALVDIKVTRRGRVSQVRVRNSWRHASICLACLRVATRRWRFAPRVAPRVIHHLLRIRPFP